MKFATKSTSETVSSREHLLALIESAIRAKKAFSLGDGCQRSLQLAAYSDEGAVLELHRGKKWAGWVSPPMVSDDAIRQIFLDYYQRGEIPDDRLTADPEWLEMEGFHPAVYVIIGVGIIGAGIYFGFFK